MTEEDMLEVAIGRLARYYGVLVQGFTIIDEGVRIHGLRYA